MGKQQWFEVVLFVLFIVTAAGAQSGKTAIPNSTKLADIKVVGSQRFQENELVTATGLKLGDQGDEAALKQAADRLAASGMFTNVTYSYTSSPDGTRAKYEVSDTEKLVAIHVDNFVWLPFPQLVSELRKREPLFRGEVPNAGEMYNKLADDMTEILAGMHVKGLVKAIPEAPQDGGDVTSFRYSVEGINLPIHSVDFPGVSPEMNTALQKITATSLINTDYSQSRLLIIATHDFLPQYHMRGFLKAAFDGPTTKLQDQTSGAVAVQLPVNEGLQYKLAAVQWSGNQSFSNDELGKLLTGKVGMPLNQVQLEEDLHAMSKLYRTRGYMEAYLKPKYSYADAERSVNAGIEIKEGDKYHMGELEFAGLSDNAAAPLRKLWKLRSGDAYDSSYPNNFLQDAAHQFDFHQLRIAVAEDIHREAKTVDVVFHFNQINR